MRFCKEVCYTVGVRRVATGTSPALGCSVKGADPLGEMQTLWAVDALNLDLEGEFINHFLGLQPSQPGIQLSSWSAATAGPCQYMSSRAAPFPTEIPAGN